MLESLQQHPRPRPDRLWPRQFVRSRYSVKDMDPEEGVHVENLRVLSVSQSLTLVQSFDNTTVQYILNSTVHATLGTVIPRTYRVQARQLQWQWQRAVWMHIDSVAVAIIRDGTSTPNTG